MIEYKRYQGKSYMIIKQAAAVAGYEYGILGKNRIPGLLSFQIAHQDEQTEFWYDISGRNSLENWGKIYRPGVDFLRKFMAALQAVLNQTGEYLLDADGISLLPEHIFTDTKESEIAFCYLPFEKAAFGDSLRSFMEYYLSHMEHGNGEDTQKCYEVYEKCQEEHTSIEELLQILYANSPRETPLQTEEIYKEPVPLQEVLPKTKEKKSLESFKKKWNFKLPSERKGKKEEVSYVFEPEECSHEISNPTVFLGSETEEIIGELRYEGDGNESNIKINTPVFLIGNEKGEADGIIRNKTISRIHAKITSEDGCYYLEDMNSTNGTYRNGELLNYMEKVMLKKNDKIIFAKEAYRFV